MSKESDSISLIEKILFGAIKTGNNVLVSEYLGEITTENIQPLVLTITGAIPGAVATFFTRISPVTYVRTATSVKKQDGSYAIGTELDPNSQAYAAIQNGQPFVGQVTIFGTPYFGYYNPIFEPGSTFVIGAFFVAKHLDSTTLSAPVDIDNANIALLKYITGPVQKSVFPFLITENQGNLTTETFQPILEAFARFSNESLTFFTLVGPDFVRTATTVLDDYGNYAVNTKMSPTNPAYQQLLNGKSYTGIVTLYGYNYLAGYVPIFDRFTPNRVIGAIFTGFPL
jgi:hypothetical protein